MKKILIGFLFIVLLAACKKTTTVTQSALGSVSGGCLIGRWSNDKLPLDIRLSPEFSAGDKPYLELMAARWNNEVNPTLGKNLIVPSFATAGVSSFASTASFNDSEFGIYKSYNWFGNVSNNALAITQFFGTVVNSPGLGNHIDLRHADIILNYDDYGSEFTMTNQNGFEYDVPTIVLHEMGHFLGLCHKNDQASVMGSYYLGASQSLYAYDKKIIKDLYVNGSISGLEVKNTNALSAPVGTEVKGIIELHADGKCIHSINGEKVFEHQTEIFKRK